MPEATPRMTRKILGAALFFIAAAILLLVLPAHASGEKTYQKIEIDWPTESEIAFLRTLPDVEVMKVETGERVVLLSTAEATESLTGAGMRPRILVEPYGAFHLKTERAWPGLGDFISYDEAVAFIHSMHSSYPDITTAPDSIGRTIEDRPIYAIKVSDNPDVNEDEPEVLFDALHHAREPITVSVVLDFLRHLCENYGTDPEATFLVDEREIWIVPVINPDGYIYNEMVSSTMMWRKNRRIIGGGCDGVDLNRNYSVNFGGEGSSGDPCSDTYRGVMAFSEPETQAHWAFIQSHDFVVHDSYHSVVGLILYSWGYTYDPAPDAAILHAIGVERARDNNYTVQQGSALYPASGTTFDWSYGTQGTFSYTTEVSGSDFWPQESEIPGLVAENLYSNIYLSLVAGSYLSLTASEVTGGDGNGRLDPGETVNLSVTLENPGVLEDATGVTVSLASDDSYIQIGDAVASYGTIAAGASASNGTDLLTISADPSTPEGHTAVIRLVIGWGAGLGNEESIALTVGQAPVIVADDFESGNNGWSQDPSHNASTGDWVIIDPNPTDFQPGDDHTPSPGTMAWITAQNTAIGTDDVDAGISALRSPAWDLSSYASVNLAFHWFHGQRDPGDDGAGDFYRVDLSNDGGATFPANLISIGDISHNDVWTPFDADLGSHLPLTNQMMIRLQASDGSAAGDIIEGGLDDLFLFDDGTGNEPPAAPLLLSPGDGDEAISDPTLLVTNAVDPEGDPLTYGFTVYDDALLTSPIRTASGVAEGTGQTGWTVSPALPLGTFWWRAYAEDAEERSDYAAAFSFDVVDISTGAEGVAGTPKFALFPARPNPSPGGATVRFLLPREGRVRADVFDVNGRRVRSLYRGLMPGGAQSLTWDGRDQRGNESAAGIYFVRLRQGNEERSIKLVLVR